MVFFFWGVRSLVYMNVVYSNWPNSYVKSIVILSGSSHSFVYDFTFPNCWVYKVVMCFLN